MASACGVLGDGSKAVKVHHLIKAPENTPESVSFRESWDASKPVTVYKTPENLPDGTPCTAVTVILRSKGCAWWWKSGCTFCGYFNDVRDDVSAEDMFSQWEFAKKTTNQFEDCGMVKVYTSGTFFEDRENPPEWQDLVLRETAQMGLHLVVEAQAQMCTPEKISWVAERHPGCTVAIGLEAYDDRVLRFHVNKGFTTKQWHSAVQMLRDNNLRVKTYLLFKPPFMSEGDALVHTTSWLTKVAPYSDEVSVNPMNIQKNTIVDRLFRNKEYRPPWQPGGGFLPILRPRIRAVTIRGTIHSNSGFTVKRKVASPILFTFTAPGCRVPYGSRAQKARELGRTSSVSLILCNSSMFSYR